MRGYQGSPLSVPDRQESERNLSDKEGSIDRELHCLVSLASGDLMKGLKRGNGRVPKDAALSRCSALLIHERVSPELPRHRELDLLRDPLGLAASLATTPERQ